MLPDTFIGAVAVFMASVVDAPVTVGVVFCHVSKPAVLGFVPGVAVPRVDVAFPVKVKAPESVPAKAQVPVVGKSPTTKAENVGVPEPDLNTRLAVCAAKADKVRLPPSVAGEPVMVNNPVESVRAIVSAARAATAMDPAPKLVVPLTVRLVTEMFGVPLKPPAVPLVFWFKVGMSAATRARQEPTPLEPFGAAYT